MHVQILFLDIFIFYVFHHCALLNDCSHPCLNVIDKLIDLSEVKFELSAHQIQSPEIKAAFSLSNYNKQDILADLLLANKVLIVHDAHLKIFAVSKLLKLSFEIQVELVHTTTKSIQEIVGYLWLEFKVLSNIAINLNIVLQLWQNNRLNEGHLSHVRLNFIF